MLGWRLLAQAGFQVLERRAGGLDAARGSGNRWVWTRDGGGWSLQNYDCE